MEGLGYTQTAPVTARTEAGAEAGLVGGWLMGVVALAAAASGAVLRHAQAAGEAFKNAE